MTLIHNLRSSANLLLPNLIKSVQSNILACCIKRPVASLLLLQEKKEAEQGYLAQVTLPRTASLLLSHIRSLRWLQASSSFPAGQSRMQPRISEQDRGDEHPTPSNGTEVYWRGLSQNYAAFLYDKWHLYAVTGKLVRKHKECMLDPGIEQSLILSGSLGKTILKV